MEYQREEREREIVEIPLLTEQQGENERAAASERERTSSLQNEEIILEDQSDPDTQNSSLSSSQLLVNPQSRRAVIFWTSWFMIVNIALIIGLVVDRDNYCKTAIKSWALIAVCLQTVIIFCNSYIHYKLPRVSQDNVRAMALFYIVMRLSNVFWIAWNCTGIVWTFQSFNCVHSMPTLYSICFILSVIHLILLGIPILLSCCTIPFLMLALLLCPERVGRRRPKGISLSKIKKLTTVKKFETDLIPQEDANCAICLSDYEVGEEIRYLPCAHHFHSECILPWLKTNNSCPFCKKKIDASQENTPSPTQTSTIQEV